MSNVIKFPFNPAEAPVFSLWYKDQLLSIKATELFSTLTSAGVSKKEIKLLKKQKAVLTTHNACNAYDHCTAELLQEDKNTSTQDQILNLLLSVKMLAKPTTIGYSIYKDYEEFHLLANTPISTIKRNFTIITATYAKQKLRS